MLCGTAALPLVGLGGKSLRTRAKAAGASAHRQSNWALGPGETASRLCGPGREIALTFDDGPSNETPRFLDVLDDLRIPATFFLCGRNVQRRQAVARAILKAGHVLGNHTHSHPMLPFCSRQRVECEVTRAQYEIASATGATPGLFRPPYGLRAFSLGKVLKNAGLVSVGWTVIGNDWKWDSERIARRVVRRTRPRAIICLHDGDTTRPVADRLQTLKAVLRIVPELRARGFRFVAMPPGPGSAGTSKPALAGSPATVDDDVGSSQVSGAVGADVDR